MGPHRCMRNIHVEHEVRTTCAISLTLVQLPRPFERRPVPEGRKFRWWRQPERLSEQPQGASCAEGSDRRNFQAGVMGRHFLPLAAFHSFLEKKESRRPWNPIPKMETFVHEKHIRILYVGPHRLNKKEISPVCLRTVRKYPSSFPMRKSPYIGFIQCVSNDIYVEIEYPLSVRRLSLQKKNPISLTDPSPPW